MNLWERSYTYGLIKSDKKSIIKNKSFFSLCRLIQIQQLIGILFKKKNSNLKACIASIACMEMRA